MIITGHYTIKAGNHIIHGDNIITLLGESFFLNRAINNEFNPIKYIVLGNSSIQAKKGDISLGNETVRKRCVSEADLNTKQIVLSCSLTAAEILGTSESGVANDEILISHDIYETITTEDITNSVDSIEITYTFDLSTASQRTNWEVQSQTYNIYYTVEENNVVGVSEDDTSSGYKAVSSISELRTNTGAYFYNTATKTLFIRTTKNDDPNNYKILILTR